MFALGVGPFRSKDDRAWLAKRAERRAKKYSIQKKLVKKKVIQPSFPILPERLYHPCAVDLLKKLPKSSVAATVELGSLLIAPAENTTRFFPWTRQQINEIKKILFINLKARWAFRRLLARFRHRTTTIKNDTDPFTLDPIVDPILLVTPEIRAIHKVEAKSIAKQWRMNLTNCDGFFSEPRFPMNPLTNLPVNRLVLHRAIQELRQKGHSDWILESFAASAYDMYAWKKKFASPLMIETIKNIFSQNNEERYDYLLDFMELMYEQCDKVFPKRLFEWILRTNTVQDYTRLWINAARTYYISKYTTIDRKEQDLLDGRTLNSILPILIPPNYIRILHQKSVKRTIVYDNIEVLVAFTLDV
jgi:hypothetical protein